MSKVSCLLFASGVNLVYLVVYIVYLVYLVYLVNLVCLVGNVFDYCLPFLEY